MAKSETPKVALITGANSGIGYATTQKMVAKGYKTFGGVRRFDSFPTVQSIGAIPLLIDITDEQSMVTSIAKIEAENSAIDILVNNAGYGQMGPIEEISLDKWQQQFQTNVLGLVRMAQLVLPGMRRQHDGHIINVSSAGGEFTFPLAGAYHASKYAVEAISDALRFEVKSFGVKVVVIQPGPVSTPLATATAESIRTTASSPYKSLVEAFHRQSGQTSGYISAERVADVILRASLSQNPHARYKVGSIAHVMTTLHRLLPVPWWDSLVARFYA